MAERQITTLQQNISSRLELLETILKSLRLEANRALTILARHKSQSHKDGVFSKAHLPDNTFKELQEYNHLISKQFCSRLDELRSSYLALKIEMEGLAKKIKTKAESSDQERLAVISNTVKSFEAKFAEIWRQQHFLVLNYKLDCAAKELQRWTAVMENNKKTPQMITQMVNSMFK